VGAVKNDEDTLISICHLWWRFGLVVASLGRSTKLLYVEPGYYWDG